VSGREKKGQGLLFKGGVVEEVRQEKGDPEKKATALGKTPLIGGAKKTRSEGKWRLK